MKSNDDMKPEEVIALTAALAGETCSLDHRMDPRGEEGNHMQAIDWLMLPMPDGKNTMSMPVCIVCSEYLQAEEKNPGESDWYLVVCTKCYKTLWIPKAHSIATNKEMINFVRDCPHCRDFSETAKKADMWMSPEDLLV